MTRIGDSINVERLFLLYRMSVPAPKMQFPINVVFSKCEQTTGNSRLLAFAKKFLNRKLFAYFFGSILL